MRKSTVKEIDEVRNTMFSRAPDRPGARVPADSNEKKAKQRLWTAAWRKSNDDRKRPSSEQIGRALLLAVCTAPDFQSLMEADLSVVTYALADLETRGFKRSEIADVMRRIRSRYVRPADGGSEAKGATADVGKSTPR